MMIGGIDGILGKMGKITQEAGGASVQRVIQQYHKEIAQMEKQAQKVALEKFAKLKTLKECIQRIKEALNGNNLDDAIDQIGALEASVGNAGDRVLKSQLQAIIQLAQKCKGMERQQAFTV